MVDERHSGPVNIRDTGLGVLVAVVWGVNFVVIDEGLAGIPPLFFAAVRFALVAVFVVIVPRPTCGWRYLVLVGLFMSAGQFGLLYVALANGMQPGTASLVLQAQVPLTILLAALIFREHVPPRRILGVGVALGGLTVVAIGRGSTVSLVGIALTVAAATSWAVGNVVSRKSGAGGLSMVVWSAWVVPVPLLVVSAWTEGPAAWSQAVATWGWAQTWSTAYTVGVATLLGFGLWNGLLAKYPASAVVPFALVVPVAGIASAWLFQGRSPSVGTCVGGVVLLVGAGMAVVPRRGVASQPVTAGETAGIRVPPIDK